MYINVRLCFVFVITYMFAMIHSAALGLGNAFCLIEMRQFVSRSQFVVKSFNTDNTMFFVHKELRHTL